MKKSLLVVGMIAVLFAGLWLWKLAREPSYGGKRMGYWIEKALSNDHSPETLKAIIGLGPEAIATLLETMTRPDSRSKEKAVEIYNKLPGLLQRVVPRPEPDPEHREAAYRTLNLISDSIHGAEMRVLVPMLTSYLSNDDRRPSRSIVDAETRVALAHGIFVRTVSAEILGSIGPDASEAVPALIAALNEKEKWRYYPHIVPRALGKIGTGARAALPTLREVLVSDDIIAAVGAAEALWLIDSRDKELVSDFLAKTSADATNCFARVKAARVHWKINSNPEMVVPVLIDLLQDSSNLWIVDTMRALGDVGKPASNAIPLLSAKLSDKDEVIQQVAAEAINKIESRP